MTESVAGDAGETMARDAAPGPEVTPGRGWWPTAAGAVAAAVAVNAYVAVSAKHPSFPFDEVSMLQMSRMIAGFDTPAVRGAGYFPGWSALMAPIWWFTSNPLTAYRAAIWLGVAVAVVTIWPLALLVRRFGVGTAQATTVAALVMILPSRAIQSDYVLSERLLFTFAVLSALAAYRLVERPTALRAVLLSLWLALLLFTHARGLPVLLAAAVWYLLFSIRHRRAGLVGLASLLVLGFASRWAGTALNVHLLGHSFSQDNTITGVLNDFHANLLAMTLLGQAWYQVIATFGLIGLGVAVVVRQAWGELRGLRFGGATYLFGTTVAVFAISGLNWASTWWLYRNPWIRLDTWIYGRYNDPFAVLLLALALATVVRGASWRAHLAGAALVLAVCVPMLLWVAPKAPTWGFVTPAHLPGILPFWHWLPTHAWAHPGWVSAFSRRNDFYLVATVAAVIVAGWALWQRRRPLRIVIALTVIAVVASVVANQPSNAFQAQQGVVPPVVSQVRAVSAAHRGTSVGYDRSCWRGQADAAGQNYWSYWLLPTIVRVINSRQAHPETTFVLGCRIWPGGRALGARRVEGSSADASTLWVMPGAVQDALARKGLLD